MSTLAHTLDYALRQANDRYRNGIYVHKLVVFVDQLDLLEDLENNHHSSGPDWISADENSPTRQELYRVAHLIDKAGIDLVICWVPTTARMSPHLLAVTAAKEHLERRKVSLRVLPFLASKISARY